MHWEAGLEGSGGKCGFTHYQVEQKSKKAERY